MTDGVRTALGAWRLVVRAASPEQVLSRLSREKLRFWAPVRRDDFTAEATVAGRDLDRARAACVGTPAQQGKLAAPEASLEQLCLLADYVIVEADGSKGLPCKAHLEYEPVIPPETDRTILVVGASGFGQPIAQAAHRPERFAALCGASAEDIVTPERLAAVLNAEGGFDTVLVNQMEDSGREAAARQLAALLPVPVWGGSLRAGQVRQL